MIIYEPVNGVMTEREIPDGSPYAEMIASVGHGIYTTGSGKGVIVGESPSSAPPGWCFLNSKDATPELIKQSVREYKEIRD